MLEAKLQQAALLKRLLDSIKECVSDANFNCDEEGIKLQAMDNSHVALVAVKLDADGFKKYRCDRPIPLGVNFASLTKVLKCARDDDIVTIKANDDRDVLSMMFEARHSDRIAEYDVKLMDIDAESLDIPETEYDARVTMPSSEFSRIVRDLSLLGESVKIELSKEGIRFASDGEAANASILLKQTDAARRKYENYGKEVKKEDEDNEEGSSKRVKKEENEDADMEDAENGDDNNDGDGEFKAKSDDEGEDEAQDDEEEEPSSKKRKKASAKNGKPAKKAKKSEEGPTDGGVMIEMNQHVTLTFSLKYLVNFSKSSALSDTVQIMMSNDVPLLVSYSFGQGDIKYYLAPKIGEE